MTRKRLKQSIKKRAQDWFNGTLVALFPLFEYLAMAVPTMREYLPENVYAYMGLFAVGGNLFISYYVKNYVKDPDNDDLNS